MYGRIQEHMVGKMYLCAAANDSMYVYAAMLCACVVCDVMSNS